MMAAECWLTTMSRPAPTLTAITRSAYSRSGVALPQSVARLVAYTPCHTRTRSPDRTADRNRAGVTPSARHLATPATVLLLSASGTLRCVTNES